MIKINKIINEKELKQAFKIREEVFVKGQGWPIDREIDEYDIINDDIVEHYIAYYNNEVAGTFRIIKNKEEDAFYVGRVVVYDKFQGLKIGHTMMQYAIDTYKGQTKKLKLSGQKQVINFYNSLGFKEYGCFYPERLCCDPKENKELQKDIKDDVLYHKMMEYIYE